MGLILSQSPTHKFWLEIVNGVGFAHLEMHKWNASALREIDRKWNDIEACLSGTLYVLKNERPSVHFLKRFGFQFDRYDGQLEIWKKELNGRTINNAK